MIENIIEFYNVYNDTLGPALRSEKEPVMSENTFVPLYQQIKDDIKSAIEHGKYKPKEQIPTEPELSAEYSVSRVTVRRAVEELCSEGYLVKQQGRGTFVSAPRIHRKFSVSNQVVSFTKTCREYGMLAGAKVAERKIVPVREDEKAFWGCGDDALLLYIQRIRTADGQPVFLEKRVSGGSFRDMVHMAGQEGYGNHGQIHGNQQKPQGNGGVRGCRHVS